MKINDKLNQFSQYRLKVVLGYIICSALVVFLIFITNLFDGGFWAFLTAFIVLVVLYVICKDVLKEYAVKNIINGLFKTEFSDLEFDENYELDEDRFKAKAHFFYCVRVKHEYNYVNSSNEKILIASIWNGQKVDKFARLVFQGLYFESKINQNKHFSLESKRESIWARPTWSEIEKINSEKPEEFENHFNIDSPSHNDLTDSEKQILLKILKATLTLSKTWTSDRDRGEDTAKHHIRIYTDENKLYAFFHVGDEIYSPQFFKSTNSPRFKLNAVHTILKGMSELRESF